MMMWYSGNTYCLDVCSTSSSSTVLRGSTTHLLTLSSMLPGHLTCERREKGMAPAHPSDLLHSCPSLTQGGTTSHLRGHFSNPVPSSWEPGMGTTTRQPCSNTHTAILCAPGDTQAQLFKCLHEQSIPQRLEGKTCSAQEGNLSLYTDHHKHLMSNRSLMSNLQSWGFQSFWHQELSVQAPGGNPSPLRWQAIDI